MSQLALAGFQGLVITLHLYIIECFEDCSFFGGFNFFRFLVFTLDQFQLQLCHPRQFTLRKRLDEEFKIPRILRVFHQVPHLLIRPETFWSRFFRRFWFADGCACRRFGFTGHLKNKIPLVEQRVVELAVLGRLLLTTVFDDFGLKMLPQL